MTHQAMRPTRERAGRIARCVEEFNTRAYNLARAYDRLADESRLESARVRSGTDDRARTANAYNKVLEAQQLFDAASEALDRTANARAVQ